MGFFDIIGFLIYGVGVRGIIICLFIGFIIYRLPCSFSRNLLWFIIFLLIILKPVSKFFIYIRTGKHKISLQMNIFTSLCITATKPLNESLNLIYKDFITRALPEIKKTAKESEEIILKTHLIPEKLIKKLPGDPEVREVEPDILTKIVNTALAVISFIIRKYIYKLNKGNLLKYLSKLKKHKYYLVIWKK